MATYTTRGGDWIWQSQHASTTLSNHLYGAERLGILQVIDVIVSEDPAASVTAVNTLIDANGYTTHDDGPRPFQVFHTFRGEKQYEITNHLGNVMVVVKEQPLTLVNNGVFQLADVVSATDYYPFGLEMPGRVYEAGRYGFGFNGKINDEEILGGGRWQDYGFRAYRPDLGRFVSVDPHFYNYADISTYTSMANNPIKNIDPDGRDWTDIDGVPITPEALSQVKCYIFHDDAFPDQATVQYHEAVARYGEGAVALSNTGTTDGFTQDWANMQGDISMVLIMMHGKNQSIRVGEGQQFTATGDGTTNIAHTKAPNIQALPRPSGNIRCATLFMYTCHSADTERDAHGSGDHAQGALQGSCKPIAQVFSESFEFQEVIGTAGAVNYHSVLTDQTPPWRDKYMMPYPEDRVWLSYDRPAPKPKKTVKL
jgi:RHS repeat-associated protein